MRIARFVVRNDERATPAYGLVDDVDGEEVVSRASNHPFEPLQLTGERFALSAVRLLPPVLPSKVMCVGKNYADHVAEMKELTGPGGDTPVIFMKPSTSVIGPDARIVHPRDSERVDFEGELAVVIGRLCRDVPKERAHDVILGYTIANDVTARDHQLADKQWTRGKSHDTFCPLGPWIETELDAGHVDITTTLDGVVMQQSTTSLLLTPIPELVAWVSAFCTLLPGDVILTGTPAGVGPMKPGQVVRVTVDGIGTLTNTVVAA